MLAVLVDALECPQCRRHMGESDGALRCESGHVFDIAREGYVNLLPGGATASTADTPEMVAARREFLGGGYFGPVAGAVVDAARAVGPAVSGIVVDAGGGTGEYLSAILDALPQRFGLSLDLSKHAARVAARSHLHAGAVVVDVWGRLPLRDASAALVTSIFAPRNAEEFARVLDSEGMLVVVTPSERHLAELVGPLGLITVDPLKQQRLHEKLAAHFTLRTRRELEYTIEIRRSDALAAAQMGPSASHVASDQLEHRVLGLADTVRVTVSVNVARFAPTRG